MTTWIGVDPSLSGTAIALIDAQGGVRVDRCTTTPTRTHAETVARLDGIERWLRRHLERARAASAGGDVLLAIEGPAFGRSDGKAHERAGLWWRLYTRAALYTRTPPLVIVPTQLKIYATGKGTSDKDAVILAVARRYPTFAGRSNDEADALVLAAMLARWDQHPIEDKPLPQTHLRALLALPTKETP